MAPRALRIAFLTPYCPTESGAGPATYLARITRVLLDMGHEPEIFSRSSRPPRLIDLYGVRVERVGGGPGRSLRLLRRLARWGRSLDVAEAYEDIRGAWCLARALEARHRIKPFDLVQCSDAGVTGLFVARRPDRPLLTRCSWVRELFTAVDGTPRTLAWHLLNAVEPRALRRAHAAYAPSRFVADHVSRRYRTPVAVVRPPCYLERPIAPVTPGDLPSRFLIHFGDLGPRKGTDLVAHALVRVWREQPDVTMIWAGTVSPPSLLARYRQLWGAGAARVLWLGRLDKGLLYAILQKAEAAILPSRCDNLPNTVIESLRLGVPVIGTRGASIDELVEPGICGALVPPEDIPALAEAMLHVWRHGRAWARPPAIFQDMEPSVAVASLLRLAGVVGDVRGVSDEAQRQHPRTSLRRPPPVLLRLHPDQTMLGHDFNVQPDGQSALAVTCANGGPWTTIVWDEMPLLTTFASSTLLTACVPHWLLGRPGSHRILLRDQYLGQSDALDFRVVASSAAAGART